MPPSIAEVHAALTAPGQMFEMEEVVIRGIPTRTWKHAPPSLRAVLEGSRVHGKHACANQHRQYKGSAGKLYPSGVHDYSPRVVIPIFRNGGDA
jgi:hypothetical protein